MQQSIPPETYDRDYFLSEICEGFDEFQENKGVSYNKSKQVRRLKPSPGVSILDAGCGRGEVSLACAQAGATMAGIDYSQAAVDLTKETLAEFPDSDIRRGDVTALPWPDETFDRVQCSDVVEHLDAPQMVPAFREFRRVLKPGGYVLIHTAPNRIFMDVGWPAAKPFVRLAGHGETAGKVDAWFKIAEEYHVNEQSVHSLRRALREAGFEAPRVWLDPDVLRSGKFHLLSGFDGPVVRLAHRAAAWRPVRYFMGNDLYGLAHRTA